METIDLNWHGRTALPQLGERVRVAFNGLGCGTVIGHFTEEGYLGVAVALENPPEWFTKQNGGNIPAYVFGPEVETTEQTGDLPPEAMEKLLAGRTIHAAGARLWQDAKTGDFQMESQTTGTHTLHADVTPPERLRGHWKGFVTRQAATDR